ncbi:unnamed protein product [Heligmosomoides polygyrus]|uniref:C2H2-type domain-containing protein n=1 Tax=Heligmosomoides polygyrus TaxID=6339 RepID=A0A3P7ZZS7_HELPZ|nr:unnamed protein product [Heligmosomoides polygyrus]
MLESHIWSRHLHNFPFSCAICRFPAIAHSSLAAHFKQAHSPGQPVEFQRKMMDELRLRDIVANSIVVPVYEEDVIYESAAPVAIHSLLQYPSKIEEHRRSHSGLKPHECLHCGQRFSQKGGLTCHMRLHTGERPYQCTWDCGKSFHSNSALKMHERTASRMQICLPFCTYLPLPLDSLPSILQAVHPRETARRAAHQIGLAAAGEDEARLRDVVNGVIEEVRIERSLRSELKVELV